MVMGNEKGVSRGNSKGNSRVNLRGDVMDELTGAAHSTQEWQALEAAHLPPFSDYKSCMRKVRMITHAKGHYIYDTEGHQILDAMAGLWCECGLWARRACRSCGKSNAPITLL